MKGACHCGAVTLEVSGPPDHLNQCNCTLCWKLGTLWGYYRTASVAVGGTPVGYRRADKAEPTAAFNFCAHCGATTHWSLLDPAGGRVGVNMRLFEPADLAGVEVRYGDRRRHDAVEPRHEARPPTVFGEGGAVA